MAEKAAVDAIVGNRNPEDVKSLTLDNKINAPGLEVMIGNNVPAESACSRRRLHLLASFSRHLCRVIVLKDDPTPFMVGDGGGRRFGEIQPGPSTSGRVGSTCSLPCMDCTLTHIHHGFCDALFLYSILRSSDLFRECSTISLASST